MTLHREREHPEFVEGCFGCKVGVIAVSTGAANSDFSMAPKAWDAELQAYRNARAQGIQPASTKMRDIQVAEEISNRSGKPFKADDSFGGLV